MQDQVEHLLSKIKDLEALISATADAQQEKDRMENEYRSSQQRFRTIFDESVIGKKIINDQLKIIKVNKSLLKMLGYKEKEMIGRQITEFSHPDYKAEWKRLQHSIWTTAMASFSFETCLIKKNGNILWVHITTILIEDGGENLGYTILEDISDRKELERFKKMITEQEQRQQIAETILDTQERERHRVSESLHNGLGQLLYGIKLSFNKIKIVSDELAPGNSAAKAYTTRLISDCIKECRNISHNIAPFILEDFGLHEAVKDICSQLKGEVKFVCTVTLPSKRIDRILEVAVYRMIQELMMNVVNHSQAAFAKVDLVVDDKLINIVVEDNGIGFRDNSAKKEGIGLKMIRSNVAILSGSLNITSPDNKGTKIYIQIPRRVE